MCGRSSYQQLVLLTWHLWDPACLDLVGFYSLAKVKPSQRVLSHLKVYAAKVVVVEDGQRLA